MKHIRLLLMVAVGVVFWGFRGVQAQNPQSVQDKYANIITRSVDVKNADVKRITEILGRTAAATGTTMAPDQANKLIVLSGNPDRIAELESLIRRMDVPPTPSQDINVELTAYMLIAGDTTSMGQPIPSQLEPALKQLRSTFIYKSYQLLDTLWIRNRVGNPAETSGSFGVVELEGRGRTAGGYTFSCMISHVTHDAKGDVIHLDGVRINTVGGNISTSIDIRPGQLVVVGKTSFTGNQALIAVLAAKIVD